MEIIRRTQDAISRQSRASVLRKMRAEVMFGNPGTGCQGVGICRVTHHGKATNCSCLKVSTWIGILPNGGMRFKFIKSSMEKHFMRKHFSWRLFQVCEAYTMPESICAKLGIEQAVIQPGIYTVWESERYLIVDF